MTLTLAVIGLAVGVVVLLLLMAPAWYFFDIRPRRLLARKRNDLWRLESDVGVPLSDLIRKAEQDAQRAWDQDWRDWRIER